MAQYSIAAMLAIVSPCSSRTYIRHLGKLDEQPCSGPYSFYGNLANVGLAFKNSELTVAVQGTLIGCFSGLARKVHSINSFWGNLHPITTIQLSVSKNWYDSVSMISALPIPLIWTLAIMEFVLELIVRVYNH